MLVLIVRIAAVLCLGAAAFFPQARAGVHAGWLGLALLALVGFGIT